MTANQILSSSLAVALATVALAVPMRVEAATPGYPDGGWRAFPCHQRVMTDPYRDEPVAINDRDLVGDATAPAAEHTSDSSSLYLRMRLDRDPFPGGTALPYGWGVLFDLDGARSTYEALVRVEGEAGKVSLYRNSQTSLTGDPSDPPNTPAEHQYNLTDVARTRVAEGSQFGANDDFFLELKIPWPDLADIGLSPTTAARVWVATASNATVLDGDLSCADGHGAGHSLLGDGELDFAVLDPGLDTDGDGFTDVLERSAGTDPNNPNSHPSGLPSGGPRLTGGAGCSVTSGQAETLALLLLAAAVVARRRRA